MTTHVHKNVVRRHVLRRSHVPRPGDLPSVSTLHVNVRRISYQLVVGRTSQIVLTMPLETQEDELDSLALWHLGRRITCSNLPCVSRIAHYHVLSNARRLSTRGTDDMGERP